MRKIFCLPFFLSLIVTYGFASVELQILEKKINVNGKEAKVLSLVQKDGTIGLKIDNKALFDVFLKNTMQVPTSIHWHGLVLPNDQDGVAFITQYPIYPDTSYTYRFPIVQTGTYWMHSHYGFQEQRLLSAPLIIYSEEDKQFADEEAILFLTDFSFKSPQEIFRELKCKNKISHEMDMSNMEMKNNDLIDVKYDAFLTNYYTLETPQFVPVEKGKKVRLRIINGSSATNFFIYLGELKGQAFAVDGHRIYPIEASQFELAVAQRIDIIVKIPDQGGIFPILAQGEGTDMQTGLVLGTNGQRPSPIPLKAATKAGALTNEQESKFRAVYPLPEKPVDKKYIVELNGNMQDYVWTINRQVWPESTPLIIEKGQRVEIEFKNMSMMSHPMHFHGHVFQVTSIDGKSIDGAVRDTVLVMPNTSLNIQFDADNPGVWPLHCHILYHMEAGMFTVVRYKDFIQPLK